MNEKYKKFLLDIDKKIYTYFEKQKPYICCKAGCSLCCSCGEYPLSRYEFEFLLHGYEMLPIEKKHVVQNNINELKVVYEKANKPEHFEHSCPFLIDNLCSVYKHRPLICRTYGLIKSVKTLDNHQVIILPECIHNSLNYSNVFDFENNCFDNKKIETINANTKPEAYDISIPSLYKQCKDKNINFEDRKNMIKFLIN